jgi:hypothetical protein
MRPGEELALPSGHVVRPFATTHTLPSQVRRRRRPHPPVVPPAARRWPSRRARRRGGASGRGLGRESLASRAGPAGVTSDAPACHPPADPPPSPIP